MSDPRLIVRAGRLEGGAATSQSSDSAAETSVEMDERVRQLERKILEQERTISGLQDDMKSLKVLQDGDRNEFQDAIEHQNTKKRKLFGLIDDHSDRLSAVELKVEVLQDGDRKGTAADIRYVTQTVCYMTVLIRQ